MLKIQERTKFGKKREHIGAAKRVQIELLSRKFPATYVAFDILRKNKENLFNKPLEGRKKVLDATIKEGKNLQIIYFTEEGKKLLDIVEKRQLEGVIAKKKQSLYDPIVRSFDWVKIKFTKTLDCIIIGYTKEKRNISAFAWGMYFRNRLVYVGRVGTGFTEKFLEEMHIKLRRKK